MAGPGTIRWWVDGGATPGLDALMADPDAALRRASSVAREQAGRKRLVRVATGADEPDLFVKVFTRAGPMAQLRTFLRPSKARREAESAARVAELGFQVAGPVATGELRRFGLLRQSYSVVPALPARDLESILAEPGLPSARRRALLGAFARFTRRLHDAGVDQDDTSPNNFLLVGESDFALIDFERCALIGRPLGERRWTLLAKLHRKDLGVSRSERLRFLASYLGHETGRRERREAWGRIAEAFLQVRRRDARHAARAAFRIGRHIVRDGESLRVRGREQARVIRLALSRDAARATWIGAWQLERLDLPALRPVRLDPDGVDLLDPGAVPVPTDREARIARALRRFAPYGRFTEPPEWLFTPAPVLRNPGAFHINV